MILPIGHEEREVRRLPWITFSVIAACFAAFLATDTSGLEGLPTRDELLQDAATYWRDHAYLDAEPEILTDVGYDVMPNQRSQYLEVVRDRARDWAPEDRETWEQEQAELDRLTDLALARVAPTTSEGANPYLEWGLVPATPRLHNYITHMFMHAGWMHLLGNLFMFFLAAPAIEDRLGRPLFGGFYLLAGIFAGAFYAALSPGSPIPLVGASGAIYGVLGAFLVRFWRTRIKFMYLFFIGFRFLYGTFQAPAWLMLPLCFANELLQASLMHAMDVTDGIAYWAHVGGFLFGVGSVGLVRVLGVEERFIHSAIERKVTVATANPALERAMEAREQGDLEQAWALLREEAERSPDDIDVSIALWDAAVARQVPEEAAPALATAIRKCAGQGDLDLAIGYWTELNNLVPTALVDPGTLLRMVPSLREQMQDERAVRALRHSVDPANSGLSAGLALRAFEEARDLDPPTALRAARRVLEFDGLAKKKRERARELAAELEAQGVEEAASAEDERREAEEVQHDQWDASGAIEIDPEWEDSGPLDLTTSRHEIVETPSSMPPPLPDEPTAPEPASGLELSADGSLVPSQGSVERAPQDAELDIECALDTDTFIPRFTGTKEVLAVPTAFAADAISLTLDGGRRVKLQHAKIQAIAVAAVRGLGAKPVLVIDLLLNWSEMDEETLRLVRLRSDRFDPRSFVGDAQKPLDALRHLLAGLLEATRATPLPDPDAVHGTPFRMIADLATYEREILQVEG